MLLTVERRASIPSLEASAKEATNFTDIRGEERVESSATGRRESKSNRIEYGSFRLVLGEMRITRFDKNQGAVIESLLVYPI